MLCNITHRLNPNPTCKLRRWEEFKSREGPYEWLSGTASRPRGFGSFGSASWHEYKECLCFILTPTPQKYVTSLYPTLTLNSTMNLH